MSRCRLKNVVPTKDALLKENERLRVEVTKLQAHVWNLQMRDEESTRRFGSGFGCLQSEVQRLKDENEGLKRRLGNNHSGVAAPTDVPAPNEIFVGR